MVRNILSLLQVRQSTILSGASVLMIAVFASKFLGLIRDRLMVHNFTAEQAEVFFVAFRLPDLLFNLVIFGALSVAFIPVFTEYYHRKGEEEAFEFASNILNLCLVVFGLVLIVAFIFVGPLNSIIAPGFTGERKVQTDQLTQLLILAQFLLVIGTFFVGISQSLQRFIVPALAPLFYNLGIIIGIIFLSEPLGIAGPAVGVVIGSALHVLVQLPFVTSLGFRHKLTFDFFNKGVAEVVKMMSFRNIGLAIEQLSETVGVALASLMATPGAVTLLTFAQHLQLVPIGLFGATLSQAALPVLSREQAQNDIASFKVTLLTTLHQILFLTLPAAAILVVLRIPVVRLVFGASQFNWYDTVLTGRTVAFLSLGLAAQSVILLLVRGFYALKDTRSPVIISVVSVAINISLSCLFVLWLGWDVWSLGLSYAVASNISCVLLLYLLDKKTGGFSFDALVLPAIKMFLASALAAVALYIPIKALDQVVFDTTRTLNLFILTGIASAFGLSVYILLVWLLRVKELFIFGNIIKRFITMRLNIKIPEIPKDGSI